MYAAAKPSRLMSTFGTTQNSADAELASSFSALRSRSRQLVRDSSYAKRAKAIITNNVIGSGVGMQAQVRGVRGELNAPVNDSIENTWDYWACAEYAHTGGTLHFCDIERLAIGQIFEAGEVLIRVHERAFGDSTIPIALEVIESERLADEFAPIGVQTGTNVRLGIEVDEFLRPIAYWIRTMHQGDIRLDPGMSFTYERVPAANIFHLKVTDRFPQTRGVPWLHTAIIRLADIDGYSEAEITAARAAASYMAVIQSPEMDELVGEEQDGGQDQIELSPGMMRKLSPGETIAWNNPNRTNSQLDPFIRLMLREISSGCGVPYENVSNDYSNSNYSSSRLALIDSRDTWKVLQLWWIRNFREPFYKRWLTAAVMNGVVSVPIAAYATDPQRYLKVKWKTRGWTWVDPEKEVAAYKEAIKAGLTTRTDVIAATADGRDIEDVDETRARELEDAQAVGLEYDTDPDAYMPPEPVAPVVQSGSADPTGDPNQGDRGLKVVR